MTVHGPLGATEAGAFELRDSRLNSRSDSSRTRVGMLGLSGLLATGLVVSIAAAGTDSLLPESVRPVPQWLAGPFGATGLGLSVGALIGVMTLMFISYAVAVQAADRLSARSVLMTIAALHALVLLAPPLVSTDVFSYQAYARMGSMYGANPYLHGPSAIGLDPVYPFIGAKWVSTPTVYGPVFTVLSYTLGSASIAASALAYKAIAAVSSLAIVAIVWNAARLRGVDPVKAAALVGLNPLVVVYGVGGGHNDMLMLALAVAGIALALQHRDRLGAGSLVIAAGVKLTAGLFLPFTLAGAGGRLSRSRRRDVLVGASVAGAAVVGLGFAVFGLASAASIRIDFTEPEPGRLAQHPRIHLHEDGTRDGRARDRRRARDRVRRRVLPAACARLARRTRLDRRRRLDGRGVADHRQLVAALVRGVADAACCAGRRQTPVARLNRHDRRVPRHPGARIHPPRPFDAAPLARLLEICPPA